MNEGESAELGPSREAAGGRGAGAGASAATSRPLVLLALAAGVLVLALLAGWLEMRHGWIGPAFDAVGRLFYEVPVLARVRRPSQLVLARWHLAVGSALLAAGLAVAPWAGRHGRAFLAIFGAGYALRAALWICGGNLPMVPGDSSHYIEVATSVLRGEGPVMHYVHSFFQDYPRIRMGQGALNDWDGPLDAYVRALAFRLAGLGPNGPLEARWAAAKTCDFVLNLLALPALYALARRSHGRRVALGAMAALAVLPVHAIYSGLILRESLVALLIVATALALLEFWRARSARGACAWAAAAGALGGLAVLARTTALAVLASAALYTIVARKRFVPLIAFFAACAAVCLPWAWATFQEHGTPFYSITRYFEYNFSWTVHHYERGNTLPSQFYNRANFSEIVRTKLKSLCIVPVYSTMIVGLPVVLGFCRRLCGRGAHANDDEGASGKAATATPIDGGLDLDRFVALTFLVFVAATLKRVADVTQVAQLGRYYMPVFVLMLPGGVAGALDWLGARSRPERRRGAPAAFAALYVVLVWAGPTWAYDVSWLEKPFHLHWPALREAGDWIQAHPEQVPRGARVMTWFPWELRTTSDRTTILMPRNYHPGRIREVIDQYGATHFLWGSFEPPPYFEINPEAWAHELDRLRVELGLTESRRVFQSSPDSFFRVRLYRLR